MPILKCFQNMVGNAANASFPTMFLKVVYTAEMCLCGMEGKSRISSCPHKYIS